MTGSHSRLGISDRESRTTGVIRAYDTGTEHKNIIPFNTIASIVTILIIYLLILYTVFPIEKCAIIFKLHTSWGSNCTLIFSNRTLIQPIRSAYVSIRRITLSLLLLRAIRPNNNNSKMATVITAVACCCRCKGTWMAETL